MAQAHEIELFDHLLSELVSIVEEPEQHMGRPRLMLSDRIFCSVMKVYSQLSSRRAQCLYYQALERQQLSHAPHFNAVIKTLLKPEITSILHDLVRLSALPLAGTETDFALDSSGFRCSSFGEYCEYAHGTKRMHNWLKVHICTGVETNIVSDVIITDEHAADSPQFPILLKNTAGHFQINEVSADPAYSSRKNHDIVDELGGKPFILFKKNATGKTGGSRLWKKAFHYFQLHRDEFDEHYHKRSNVESTFSAIKKKFGETLKSRKRTAQVNEMLCKVIAYNITVLIHAMFELGINPNFESSYLFDLSHGH
jgi:transposase